MALTMQQISGIFYSAQDFLHLTPGTKAVFPAMHQFDPYQSGTSPGLLMNCFNLIICLTVTYTLKLLLKISKFRKKNEDNE